MSRWYFLFLVIVGLACNANAPSAHAQFGDLVQHLPSGANTLLLFDFEKMLASPAAAAEGWREKQEKAFAAGFIIAPPQTTRFATAALLDFETNRPSWDASVMNLQYEPSMPKVAAFHGGTVDEIDGRKAAILPSDTYVVQWGKQMVGVMSPGNRQAVGHWIQQVYSTSTRQPLSEYLQEAKRYADGGTPIILALDLEHVASAAEIAQHLASSATLEGRNVDVAALSQVLASIRGATLGITINDKVFGKFKIDFAEDVSMMKDYAKPLLLEVLAKRGATINEFYDWKAEVNGTQVSIEGYLENSGRQRIMSLIDAPPALRKPESQGTTTGEADPEKVTALASQQYFNSITSLVDDLRGDKDKVRTFGELGVWYGKYARKIDSLPILNVDRDLVAFGGDVANAFRQCESAMQGIGAGQAMRISEKPNAEVYNYAYAAGGGVNRWGGYAGGYSYRYRENPRASLALEGQERSQIRTQERIKGNASANQIMQQLDSEMAKMRVEMTNRYGVEF